MPAKQGKVENVTRVSRKGSVATNSVVLTIPPTLAKRSCCFVAQASDGAKPPAGDFHGGVRTTRRVRRSVCPSPLSLKGFLLCSGFTHVELKAVSPALPLYHLSPSSTPSNTYGPVGATWGRVILQLAQWSIRAIKVQQEEKKRERSKPKSGEKFTGTATRSKERRVRCPEKYLSRCYGPGDKHCKRILASGRHVGFPQVFVPP